MPPKAPVIIILITATTLGPGDVSIVDIDS